MSCSKVINKYGMVPVSSVLLPNYAQEDNDRWLFQTGSAGLAKQVKLLPFHSSPAPWKRIWF